MQECQKEINKVIPLSKWSPEIYHLGAICDFDHALTL